MGRCKNTITGVVLSLMIGCAGTQKMTLPEDFKCLEGVDDSGDTMISVGCSDYMLAMDQAEYLAKEFSMAALHDGPFCRTEFIGYCKGPKGETCAIYAKITDDKNLN